MGEDKYSERAILRKLSNLLLNTYKYTVTHKIVGAPSNFSCFMLLHISEHSKERRTEQKKNKLEQLSQIKKKCIRLCMKQPKI